MIRNLSDEEKISYIIIGICIGLMMGIFIGISLDTWTLIDTLGL